MNKQTEYQKRHDTDAFFRVISDIKGDTGLNYYSGDLRMITTDVGDAAMRVLEGEGFVTQSQKITQKHNLSKRTERTIRDYLSRFVIQSVPVETAHSNAAYHEKFDNREYQALASRIATFLDRDRESKMVAQVMTVIQDLCIATAELGIVPDDVRTFANLLVADQDADLLDEILSYVDKFASQGEPQPPVTRPIILCEIVRHDENTVRVDVHPVLVHPPYEECEQFHKVIFTGFTVILVQSVKGFIIDRPMLAAQACVNWILSESEAHAVTPEKLTLMPVIYSNEWPF